MSNKGIVLLLLALVVISVSGCLTTEKNKTGWDWEKYDKYSKFYDTHNTTKTISNPLTIEEFMINVSKDTEFDNTWYFTFFYLLQAAKADEDSYAGVQTQYDRDSNDPMTYSSDGRYNPAKRNREIDHIRYVRTKEQLNKSYIYRQKIEEMKPPR